MDEDLTLAEAAARCGLSVVTLRTQYYRGRLPAVLRGNTLFVRWSDVEAYLASRQHTKQRRDVDQAESKKPDKE